jgi:hypothetical protein
VYEVRNRKLGVKGRSRRCEIEILLIAETKLPRHKLPKNCGVFIQKEGIVEDGYTCSACIEVHALINSAPTG